MPQKIQIVRRVIEDSYDVTEADVLRERFRKVSHYFTLFLVVISHCALLSSQRTFVK